MPAPAVLLPCVPAPALASTRGCKGASVRVCCVCAEAKPHSVMANFFPGAFAYHWHSGRDSFNIAWSVNNRS